MITCVGCEGGNLTERQGVLLCCDCLTVTAAGPRYPDPRDHPVYQEYQPSADHVVAAYDRAHEAERQQGGRWYEDAHHIAAAVGQHTGIGTHAAAGLVAAYSPQMEWHSALHNAVRSAHQGDAVQQGQGPYVSNSHAKAANKILTGEHHQTALGGSKSQDMAHLIEHGGRDPETGGSTHRVSVGSEEFAVASGLGYSDEQSSNDSRKVLGNRHYYDHLAGIYHQAAQHLSARDGTPVAGHQVQATINLAARRTAEHDAGLEDTPTRDREVGRTRRYITEQHPDLGENTHLGYNETKAPEQVDTLRDEACPVCGETDAWDGDECKVCGFVAPPSKFQDPDVDMAKKLDLRQDDAPGGGDVNDLNADINDQDRDGFDDTTGEPIEDEDEMGADDQQPMLVCPNCGYQVEAGEPTSVSTEDDPAMGDDSVGPAEGDLCPNCGKAPLVAGAQLGEEGDEEDVDPDDPNADPDANPDEDQEESNSPFPPKNGDNENNDDGNAEHPDQTDEEDDDDPDQDDDDDSDEDDPGKPADKRQPPWKK